MKFGADAWLKGEASRVSKGEASRITIIDAQTSQAMDLSGQSQDDLSQKKLNAIRSDFPAAYAEGKKQWYALGH